MNEINKKNHHTVSIDFSKTEKKLLIDILTSINIKYMMSSIEAEKKNSVSRRL